MKLYLRLLVAFTASFATYVIFMQIHSKPSAQIHKGVPPSDNSLRKRNLAKVKFRRKVSNLVADQDLEEKNVVPRQMKATRPGSKSNTNLSKLIFQLWDTKAMSIPEENSLCTSLASVDDKVYKQGKLLARKLNKRFFDKVNASAILQAISENCDSVHNIFKFKDPPGYTKKSLRDAYPIAFTVHLDKPAEQSLRVLHSIYHPDNIYCLQPNLKRGAPFVEVFRRLADCVPNILLPEKLYRVSFKTHEKIKAELKCFEEVLRSKIPWKYGVNLPSSAFPLRNNSFLVDFLKSKPYENYMDWKAGDENFIRRTKFVHEVREFGDSLALVRTSQLKSLPPKNMTLFRKGSYFISTREFYEFLVNSNMAKELLAWSEDTKYPEEFFYATLHRYPGTPGGQPFDDTDASSDVEELTGDQENVTDSPNGDLLASLWRSDKSHRCHGAYRGGSCIFGAADLRWLIAQDNLFALSFDYRIDRVALECLTRNLIKPIVDDTIVDRRTDLPASI